MVERLHIHVVVLALNSHRLSLRVIITRKDGVLFINLKWIISVEYVGEILSKKLLTVNQGAIGYIIIAIS